MSFCVVPRSAVGRHPLLLGVGHVEPEQPRRRSVDRHRRVHLADRDRRRAVDACGRGGRRARRPCRPRRVPAGRRRRSRSGSAGRRRSTGPSGPWPGWSGRARSTPGPWSGRSRSASSTGGRARGPGDRAGGCVHPPIVPQDRPRCHDDDRSVTVVTSRSGGRGRARPAQASGKGLVGARIATSSELEVPLARDLDRAERLAGAASATARRGGPRRWPATARPARRARPSRRPSPVEHGLAGEETVDLHPVEAAGELAGLPLPGLHRVGPADPVAAVGRRIGCRR